MQSKSPKNNKNQFFQNQGAISLQCGLHCINHLLGQHVYDPEDLKNICYQLSDQFINPHKHIMGGDYSVDVIMVALARKGYDCQWHDRRKQFFINDSQDTVGYLINYKSQRKLYHKILGISARHWVIVKRQGNQYFDYDSTKDKKMGMGQKKYAEQRLKQLIKEESEVIRVFKQAPQQQNEQN